MNLQKATLSDTSPINNHKKEQMIESTVQENRKGLKHNKNRSEAIKSSNVKIKSKVRQNKQVEQKRAINSNSYKRELIIKNILQEKRKEITLNNDRLKGTKRATLKRKMRENKKVYESETALEDDVPLARLLNHSKIIQPVQIPEICGHNWNTFKKEIEDEKTQKNNQKVKKCLDKMHGYQVYALHFSALHFIRKAIVDSLISRKWDNLVKLLVMLIKNYSDPVFTVFIRHMCEILKHYHPRIQGTDLEDQIELIMEKHENIRNNILNVSNRV